MDKLCNCMTKTPDPSYHKFGCPVRRGIKFPTLFYYEEGVNAFIPIHDNLENLVDINCMGVGEVEQLQIKRLDLTDEELDALPESC